MTNELTGSELLVLSWEVESGSSADMSYWLYSDGTESWQVEAKGPEGQLGGGKSLTEAEAQSIFDQCPAKGQTLRFAMPSIRG